MLKKYRLHRMWGGIAIYGETPEDAITKKGLIPRADRIPKPTGTELIYNQKTPEKPEPQPDLRINGVLAKESTSKMWGTKPVIRLLCDTFEGVVAIDMCEEQVDISSVDMSRVGRKRSLNAVEQH